MVAKLTKKQIYKWHIIVFVCLLIAGSSAYRAVLCFCADGRIDIKPALYQQYYVLIHCYHSDQNQLSCQVDRAEGKHCELCVNVSFPPDLFVKISSASNTSKQLNPTPTPPASVTNAIAAGDKFNFSAYNLASTASAASSYFAPLHTVILLV